MIQGRRRGPYWVRALPGSLAVARRPERRPAGGRPRDQRTRGDPRRGRLGQDPGHQPPGGVRHRDRVVPPDQVLVVTFTDKAAGEMVERLRALGLPGVTARTFHAHALSQLRHFWPLHHDGDGAAGPARFEALAARPARPRPARPLPVHAGEGPRRRDRMGQEPPPDPDDVRRRGCRRARRPPRASHPSRSTSSPASSPAMSAPRRAPAGSTSTTCSRGRSTCSRRTRTPPRPSARASAGSAWTSTRTRTRCRSGSWSCGSAIGATCASWATRTRPSTRSPAPRAGS